MPFVFLTVLTPTPLWEENLPECHGTLTQHEPGPQRRDFYPRQFMEPNWFSAP